MASQITRSCGHDEWDSMDDRPCQDCFDRLTDRALAAESKARQLETELQEAKFMVGGRDATIKAITKSRNELSALIARFAAWAERLDAYWRLHPMHAFGERKWLVEERDAIAAEAKAFVVEIPSTNSDTIKP